MTAPQVIESRAELIRALPLVPVGAQRQYKALYSVRVPRLAPSDVVHLIGQFQLVNDSSGLVQIVRYIARNGTPLTPAHGDDVSTEQHYLAEKLVGVDTGQMGDVTYSIVADAVALRPNDRSASTPDWLDRLLGRKPRWTAGEIPLKQGYGFLAALIFRAT